MKLYAWTTLCGIALALTGCGEGDAPQSADVSGVVTLRGKPLSNAEVLFVNGEHQSVGHTDGQGRFQLSTGALPGLNRVCIRKVDRRNARLAIDPGIEGMDAGQFAEMRKHRPPNKAGRARSKNGIPPEYGDPATTRLTIDVPAAGTTSANFNL